MTNHKKLKKFKFSSNNTSSTAKSATNFSRKKVPVMLTSKQKDAINVKSARTTLLMITLCLTIHAFSVRNATSIFKAKMHCNSIGYQKIVGIAISVIVNLLMRMLGRTIAIVARKKHLKMRQRKMKH